MEMANSIERCLTQLNGIVDKMKGTEADLTNVIEWTNEQPHMTMEKKFDLYEQAQLNANADLQVQQQEREYSACQKQVLLMLSNLNQDKMDLERHIRRQSQHFQSMATEKDAEINILYDRELARLEQEINENTIILERITNAAIEARTQVEDDESDGDTELKLELQREIDDVKCEVEDLKLKAQAADLKNTSREAAESLLHEKAELSNELALLKSLSIQVCAEAPDHTAKSEIEEEEQHTAEELEEIEKQIQELDIAHKQAIRRMQALLRTFASAPDVAAMLSRLFESLRSKSEPLLIHEFVMGCLNATTAEKAIEELTAHGIARVIDEKFLTLT